MTTVQDILTFIETLAPTALKMDWDNVGLNCGSRSAPVKRILVALDPFAHVCREAADRGADLLVTHHPLIFQPLSSVTDDAAITRGLMTLVQHNISHICAHTNLDAAPGGVNDVLAQTLGLENITPVGENEWGMLRCGTAKEQCLEDFLFDVSTALGCEHLRYCDGGKSVCKVAVGGGACGSELADVVAAGCDTFVTADVKYNQFWDAKEMGINLVDAGHFHTENPVCAVLADKLQAAFPDVQVILSKKHADCVNFY